MFYSVLLCLSLTFLFPQCYTNSMEASRYECGRHGKFEYCIDGIPGCVIGCHCHPGYYFDTETKICEPNLKLSEDFKRRFMLDPNRMYPINTPALTQNIPTQTTTNTANDRIDEMSKDTDDIGEWLYNQFFKTIETQVINKTNDDKPMTRRNMNDLLSIDNESKHDDGRKTRGSRKSMKAGNNIKKGKKKSKSSKSRGKKSKSKVHGLRRKLLRITEDDSLFDSESESESGEDASSSSSTSSESESIEDKVERGHEKNDRDHGHKKVIIFNRRPRPPLPSFIFLPNMDTPYYPPIGLPPPPILPMYPMIPVPPMAPFLPAIEKDKSCQNATSKPEDTRAATTPSQEPSSEPSTTTEEQDSATVPDPSALRNSKRSKSKYRKQSKPVPAMKSEELFLMRARDLEPSLPLTAKQMERMQLINTLKEKLKMKKNKQIHRENDANASDENFDLLGDVPAIPDYMPKHTKKSDRNINDVNFKYLSQLIHRAKVNSTEIPPLSSDIHEKKMESPQKTRRLYDQEIPVIQYDEENITPRSSLIKDQNDEYFMKLGRQIASLIRDEDVKLQNKVTDAPEANSLQESINSILNENRYAPRSYWERFVRSPLSRLKSYLSGLRFFKEDNLFSLEDEVKTFASTKKPLTLQDIENLLSSVQKDNSDLNNTYIHPKPSEVSFNVNLLPRRDIILENHFRRMHEAPDNYIARTIKTTYLTKERQNSAQHDAAQRANSNMAHFMDKTKNGRPLSKVSNIVPTRIFTAKLSDQPVIDITTKNKSLNSDNSNNSSLKYFPINAKMNTKLKISQGEYLKFLKKNPVVINPNLNKSRLNSYPELLAKFNVLPAKLRKLPDKSKSTLIHYNNLNYFSDQNKQHYLFEATYPLDATLKQSFSKRIETDKPSYFHHEFHHFDYFD